MSDLISRKEAICAIEHRLAEPAYLHIGEDWYVGMNCAESELYDLPSTEPKQRYTDEELKVFQHGISLSLLSKRSSQHWKYDEKTATEIKFLERLYEKVSADMRGDNNDCGTE